MGAPEGGGALEENFTAYYATAGQQRIAERLWAESGYGPKDVNVAQCIWLPLQDAPFQAIAIGELVCIDHSIAGLEPHKRSHIGPSGSRDSYEPRRASEQQDDS